MAIFKGFTLLPEFLLAPSEYREVLSHKTDIHRTVFLMRVALCFVKINRRHLLLINPDRVDIMKGLRKEVEVIRLEQRGAKCLELLRWLRLSPLRSSSRD